MATTNILRPLLPLKIEDEGWSSTLLQEFADRIDVRKQQVRHQMYTALAQSYAEHEPSGGTASADGQQEIDSVLFQLRNLPGEATSTEAKIAQLAGEHRDIVQQLAAARQEAQAAEALAQLQERLAEFDRYVASGQYGEAAWCALELERVTSAHNADTEPTITKKIKGLRQALGEEIRGAIAADPDQHKLAVAVTSSDGAALSEVFRALEVLGTLSDTLVRIAEGLMTGLFMPLLSHQASTPVRIDTGVTSVRGREVQAHILEWSSNRGHAAGRVGALEDTLLQSLDFIREHALEGNAALCGQLGEVLWPRLAAAYQRHHLAPLQPASEADLPGFHAAAAEARRLELQAAELGYVSILGDAKPGVAQIHEWVDGALEKFLHIKRLRMVAEARQLILAPQAETLLIGVPLPPSPAGFRAVPQQAEEPAAAKPATGDASPAAARQDPSSSSAALNWGPEGAEGPLLAIGRFRVTRTAAALCQLLLEAVAGACQAGSRDMAASMCRAVEDAAVLMVALPSAQPPEDAQAACLYHNDCVLVSHTLLALPYLYAPFLAEAAGGPVQFIATAEAVVAAGRARLAALAHAHKRELHEALSAAEGWHRVHMAQRGISCRRAAQQVLLCLRRTAAPLRGLLPPAHFVAHAAGLLQELAGSVVDSVLEMGDISAEESEDLPGILQPLVEEAAAATVGGEGGATVQEHADDCSTEVLQQAVEDAAPLVRKFRKLLFILSARLVAIRDGWEQGALQAAGFSAGETSHLIHALFEATELRAEVLARVWATESKLYE